MVYQLKRLGSWLIGRSSSRSLGQHGLWGRRCQVALSGIIHYKESSMGISQIDIHPGQYELFEARAHRLLGTQGGLEER